HRLGVARRAGAHHLVARLVGPAARVFGHGARGAFRVLGDRLNSPEAAAGEYRRLGLRSRTLPGDGSGRRHHRREDQTDALQFTSNHTASLENTVHRLSLNSSREILGIGPVSPAANTSTTSSSTCFLRITQKV